jgi:hypothetical protein
VGLEDSTHQAFAGGSRRLDPPYEEMASCQQSTTCEKKTLG